MTETIFSPTFILQLVIAVGTAGAVYGALRADLKNLRERVTDVKEAADQAHERIDEILRDGAKAR